MPWRDVTCCPPNVARLLASLPGYCYGESDAGLWVHLYGASRVRAAGLDVEQRTVFPWEGRVELHVAPAPGADPEAERSLFLRVPAWSSRTVVAVNGAPWSARPVPGEYLEIRGRWSDGDLVVIDLDVRPALVACNPRVAENRGSVALRRGPLVYCVESTDNPDVDPLDAGLCVRRADEIVVQHRAGLLDGVVTLQLPGRVPDGSWGGLYQPLLDHAVERARRHARRGPVLHVGEPRPEPDGRLAPPGLRPVSGGPRRATGRARGAGRRGQRRPRT